MWQNDETEWKGTNGKEFKKWEIGMWSEKWLQDVDKIEILLRFKKVLLLSWIYSCEDTDFAFWKDIGVCPNTPLFIGAFTIPRNLTKDILEYYYKNSQFNIPDKNGNKSLLI